jgi:hypothetical protein
MSTSPVLHLSRRFTAADRCDRCSAHARVLAVLHSGGELYFCDHHARVHRPALRHKASYFGELVPCPNAVAAA